MSCNHPRTLPELPCPWPNCTDGTPQKTLVLVEGNEAVVKARQHSSLRVEADGGVSMWRRRETCAGWEWQRLESPQG